VAVTSEGVTGVPPTVTDIPEANALPATVTV